MVLQAIETVSAITHEQLTSHRSAVLDAACLLLRWLVRSNDRVSVLVSTYVAFLFFIVCVHGHCSLIRVHRHVIPVSADPGAAAFRAGLRRCYRVLEEMFSSSPTLARATVRNSAWLVRQLVLHTLNPSSGGVAVAKAAAVTLRALVQDTDKDCGSFVHSRCA